MVSGRERRILKELKDIVDDQKNTSITAEPVNPSSVSHLKGIFTGPPDTPYAGGRYVVDIQIPDAYPFKPPVMRFETKIWHPNISSQTGAICLDTLGTGWSPVQTIKTALISLRMLLEFPNEKDPQDAEVAKMLIHTPVRFAQVARDWAVQYASAPPDEGAAQETSREDDAAAAEERKYQGYNRNLVDRFASMGFTVDHVVATFSRVGVERKGGQDYEMSDAIAAEVTARLLGE